MHSSRSDRLIRYLNNLPDVLGDQFLELARRHVLAEMMRSPITTRWPTSEQARRYVEMRFQELPIELQAASHSESLKARLVEDIEALREVVLAPDPVGPPEAPGLIHWARGEWRRREGSVNPAQHAASPPSTPSQDLVLLLPSEGLDPALIASLLGSMDSLYRTLGGAGLTIRGGETITVATSDAGTV